jgi:hypothetical protein
MFKTLKKVILFLDFDGVTHHYFPISGVNDSENTYFYFLRNIESVIRDFNTNLDIKIVISSSWRKRHTLEEMKQHFSEDIKEKVISSTPIIDEYKRFEEISLWIKENNFSGEWFALDDVDAIFSDKTRLIHCYDQFSNREIEILSTKLKSLI